MSQQTSYDGSSRIVDDRGRSGRWSVVLPAITFLLGALLAGSVVAVALHGGSGASSVAGGASSPTPTTSPTPGPSDVTVRVPAVCVQAASRADDAYALLQQGVEDARRLDLRALAGLVGSVNTQRQQVQDLIAACRAQAGPGLLQPAPTPS